MSCTSLTRELSMTENGSSLLPAVTPEDPATDDVPFLGLLNPRSGSRAGARFLSEAAKLPSYRHRLFDIVAVATKPEVMAEFSQQLDNVKAETIEKMERHPGKEFRPRLISGGGDGTASFAIWCVFRALLKEGGGYRWTDEELRRFFPALVQMPLGTGNDLAGELGWGRDINPASRREVQSWFKHAVSSASPHRSFDVWGITPKEGRASKICALKGLEDGRFPQFGEAGPSVPFISLLYVSMGFDAFVAAQVELHRTDSRIENFLEYARAIPSTLIGDQRRNVDLTGLRIGVSNSGQETRAYFPKRGSTGEEYCSVGVMNINSIGGGIWSAKDPALADDGKLDFFRQRSFIKNVLRRGNRYNTEKYERASIIVPGHLPGIHFQHDGEARFLFHPEGRDHELELRRVMQIPVVLGPSAPLRTAVPKKKSGGGTTWMELPGHDVSLPDAAFIPAVSMQECRDLCIRHGFGGFCVRDGRAHFRAAAPSELLGRMERREGCTFHLRDGSEAATFRFTGSTEEITSFRLRLEEWVTGRLGASLNATAKEILELQTRSDAYCRGLCRRGTRVHQDFGVSLCMNHCTNCGGTCANQGCKGCRRRFCQRCFPKHLGTAPNIQWMYGDVGVFGSLARNNRLRWSARLSLDEAITEMEVLSNSLRPIRLRVLVVGEANLERVLVTPKAATSWLRDLRTEDEDTNKAQEIATPPSSPAKMPPPSGANDPDSDVDLVEDWATDEASPAAMGQASPAAAGEASPTPAAADAASPANS